MADVVAVTSLAVSRGSGLALRQRQLEAPVRVTTWMLRRSVISIRSSRGRLASSTSEPVATCPECSAVATRQFHAPPVFFKGSGWYVNDYGKGRSNGTAAEKDKKEAKDPDSKDKVSANKDSDSNSKKDSSSNTTKSD